MLKLGKPKPGVQPQNNGASANNCADADAVPKKAPSETSGEADEAAYLPAPSYHDAFGIALQAAFDKLDTDAGDAPSGASPQKSGGKKKKAKSKGRVLFSTGVVAPTFH